MRETFQVAAFRRGDRVQLEQFFELYFDRLFDLIWRLTADNTVAEDLSQEVMVKVHRAADTLDPNLDPWRWLVTIALNTCRDYWDSATARQRRSHHALLDDDEGALAAPVRDSDPAVVSISREEAALVQHAIGEMPQTARTVVVLRDYEGLSYEEIADTLGMTQVAIRKRHSRGLALLGRLLRARGV